mmetsp:Transcript_15916/g.36704  ORF Transcript_15916/g.36704 Transcript_15916/m.36704 type:complete len:83 (+) Transcript_15916:1159-1407(+)
MTKRGNSSFASTEDISGPGIIITLGKDEIDADADDESGNSGDTTSSRHLSNDFTRKDLPEFGDSAFSTVFRSVVRRGLGDSL